MAILLGHRVCKSDQWRKGLQNPHATVAFPRRSCRTVVGSLPCLMRERLAGIPWTAAGIAISGVVVSLLGWALLLQDRQSRMRETLELLAHDSRSAIHSEVEGLHRTLRNLASFWTQFGVQSDPEWHFDTSMVLDEFPGVEWVAWVDADARSARYNIEGLDHLPPTVYDQAVDFVEKAGYVFPVAESSTPTYRVFLPVDVMESSMLIASVRIPDLLEPVLSDLARSFHVSVLWDSTEVMSTADAAADISWAVARGPMPSSLGFEWIIEHRPTADYAGAMQSSLPHALLAAGIILALALGILATQNSTVRRNAQQLDRANRALDRRVREAEAKDQQLQRLNRTLEARVDSRTRELADAVEELRAFNYSVSHDLRSPLGAILNFSVLLEEDYAETLGAEGADWLRRIRESAGSAMALLEGLLDLSRVGRSELEVQPLDVEELVQAVFQELGALDGFDNTRLVCDSLPVTVGDPTLVKNVLANLVSNAAKYAHPDRNPEVRVSGWGLEDGQVAFCVEDNGIGFDMKFSDRLFRAFQRLPESKGKQGTGIGLAVVSRIISRHGGRVWAESESGRGSRFYFTLPTESETIPTAVEDAMDSDPRPGRGSGSGSAGPEPGAQPRKETVR